MKDNKITERKLKEFLRWCVERGTSRDTCEQYVRYIKRGLDTNNKWSILAHKKWARFVGDNDLWASLRTRRSGVDFRVPNDAEVAESLRRVSAASSDLELVYRILVESGARMKHVYMALVGFESSKLMLGNGFVKYPIGITSGPKQQFYIYMISQPRKVNISYKWLTNWIGHHPVVKAKHIRKWVATKMLSLGIPEEVVNFIQGRAPQQILSRHYLKLTVLADQYYPRYAQWLRRFLAGVGLVA